MTLTTQTNCNNQLSIQIAHMIILMRNKNKFSPKVTAIITIFRKKVLNIIKYNQSLQMIKILAKLIQKNKLFHKTNKLRLKLIVVLKKIPQKPKIKNIK